MCCLRHHQSRQCSPTGRYVLMCKQKPSDLHIPDSPEPTTDSTADNNMDVHILMDVFTLCAVAVLVIIFIVVQVTKKKKQLLATRSTAVSYTHLTLPTSDLV